MAFGNMTATNALRSFEQAARAVKQATAAVVREQQSGFANPQIAINSVKSAKQALAIMEAAAQTLKAQGAWHRDYRNVLAEAQSAVASINDAAEAAADEAARQSDAEGRVRDYGFSPSAKMRGEQLLLPSKFPIPPTFEGLRSRRRRRRSRR